MLPRIEFTFQGRYKQTGRLVKQAPPASLSIPHNRRGSRERSSPMKRLHPGDPFPTISGMKVGGGTVTLPADLSTAYGIILTYRAHW